MTDTVDKLLAQRVPTAARPLLGLTLLLVEDSRFVSEAMRMMCMRSGARLRRADSLKSANRHLTAYRPSAVIIDLGLPDGSGTALIEELARQDPGLPVLATSGDDNAAETALAAGAQGFIAKPIGSLGVFQNAVLSLLPEDARPMSPRVVSQEIVHPDAVALNDDLAHAAELLSAPAEPETLAYVAQFLSGVARSAGDAGLADAAQGLRKDPGAAPGIAAMLDQRIAQAPVL
ncbi:MAG: response regulator [Pseudomonadota bacterium]